MGMAGKIRPATGVLREPAAVEYNPFYERLAAAAPDAMFPRVSLPFLLAAGYYLLHNLVFAGSGMTLFPLLLSAIIFVVPLLIYLVNGILGELMDQLDNRIGTGETPAYPAELTRLLTDRNFLIAGLCLGLAAPAAAWWLGLGGEEPAQPNSAIITTKNVTITIGYFLAGAICGVAAWGITGIVSTIRAFVRLDKPRYDFTAPDGCGGMLFLGRAVTTMGIIVLVGGVLITSYILTADSHVHSNSLASPTAAEALQDETLHDETGPQLLPAADLPAADLPEASETDNPKHIARPSESIILWTWIVAPYLVAIMVLVVPTFEIHNSLHAYKVGEDRKIDGELAGLDRAIEAESGGSDALKTLRLRHARTSERRAMLYGMSTWPFSRDTHLKFSALMVLNALWTFFSARESGLKEILASFVGTVG